MRYNLTRFADSRCRGIQSFKGSALILLLVKLVAEDGIVIDCQGVRLLHYDLALDLA